MQINELINVERKKKQLVKKRQKLIQSELRKKQRDRVNIDQSSLKKGFIEKTKLIQKKKFETIVQKARKIQVTLQDNVSVNTFISESSHFLNTLQRTKKYISFDNNKMREGIAAIVAFALKNHQKAIHFTLKFEKNIECNPWPCQIELPYPQNTRKVIVIVPQIKEGIETNLTKIKEINLELLTMKDFIHRCKNEKQFIKELANQNIKGFIDFKLFKDNKFVQNLLKKGIVVFPIDSKKIPYELRESFTEYSDYLKDLSNHYYIPLKAGLQHEVKFKLRSDPNQLMENAQSAIYRIVARLLERNKNKPNRLQKLSVKSASSISIEIYSVPAQAN